MLAYLNTTKPLALSRKRDAFVLTGAAGISILLLIVIIIIFIPILKKNGAQNTVASGLNQDHTSKNIESISKVHDHDNITCTSETERGVCIFFLSLGVFLWSVRQLFLVYFFYILILKRQFL